MICGILAAKHDHDLWYSTATSHHRYPDHTPIDALTSLIVSLANNYSGSTRMICATKLEGIYFLLLGGASQVFKNALCFNSLQIKSIPQGHDLT